MKGLISISASNVVITRAVMKINRWANVAEIETATAISNCTTERTGVKQYVHASVYIGET